MLAQSCDFRHYHKINSFLTHHICIEVPTDAMRFFSAPSARRQVAVALSGGVDSSVAAHLLTKMNMSVLGIHMSNWDYHGDDDGSKDAKCWEQDWKDAQAVAVHLNIPISHASFEADYWNSVFEPYIANLSQSLTPNPDVDCNRYIKFGVLKKYVRKRFGIDTLATGHYARLYDGSDDNVQVPLCLEEFLDSNPEYADLLDMQQPILMAARDIHKDQSYFLCGLSASALSGVMFPLGDLNKSSNKDSFQVDMNSESVRDIAQSARLPTASKRESMGICFIGKRRHAQFVDEYIERKSGHEVKATCINVDDGSVVSSFYPSETPSLAYATIGQGAKIAGAAQKWFVVDKPDTSTILVCPGTHHPALYSDSFTVEKINWIQGIPPKLPLKAQCRIRHLQPLNECEVRATKDHQGVEVILENPFRGIAAGQVCGIYLDGLVCLGGGAITTRGATYHALKKELPGALHPAGNNDLSIAKRKIEKHDS